MQLEHQTSSKQTVWLFGLVVVAILVVFAYLGGTPSADKIPTFIIGVALTIGGMAAIGGAGWYLMASSLPAGQKVIRQQWVSGQARYLLGLLVVLGTLSTVLGAVWDEVWHVKYGIPFGEDFLWRPHQMLYFGFLVTIGVAAWGLFSILTKGKGTLQQRFRADPPVSMAIMSGAFLAFALPADPAWHSLYGQDLTAWSIPHIVLLILILVSTVSTIGILISLTKKPTWSSILKSTGNDVLIMFSTAGLLAQFVLLLLVEWYTFRGEPGSEAEFFLNSPPWIFAVLLLTGIMLVGGIALFTTRKVGIVTVITLLALAIRYGVESVMGAVFTGINPYFVILPVALALDASAYYFMIVRRQSTNRLLVTGIITIAMGVIGIPILNALFELTPIPLASIPATLIASYITIYTMLWIAETISNFVWGLSFASDTAEEIAPTPVVQNIWINGAVYAGFALIAAFLFLTAVPPA